MKTSPSRIDSHIRTFAHSHIRTFAHSHIRTFAHSHNKLTSLFLTFSLLLFFSSCSKTTTTTTPITKPTTPTTPTVKTYQVTFNTNGGTAVAPQTINAGDKAKIPTPPTKTGFTFENWYKATALTTLFDFTKEVINTNTTVYAKWKKAVTVTVNYEGLHYVHFTVNYPNLSASKTLGFLITPVGSNLSKAQAETKKGYITRTFTAAKKSRAVFMFLHEGTAYDLTAGSTNIPFVAGGKMNTTKFETTDILQENTAYKIRIYDGNDIIEKTFTTKSFADGDASATGFAAYMGGLVATTKAAVALTIERKPEEMMLIPYANDNFRGSDVIYFENSSLRGACSPNCGSGVSGAYVYALRQEANKLASMVFIFSPQVKITPTNWNAGEGTVAGFAYNIVIISE